MARRNWIWGEKWVKPESFEGLRYTPLATDCVALKKPKNILIW